MEFKENILFDNRYRLTKEIGRGAFGEVWLAHDEQLDFDVAIKIYVALDSHGLKEFKNEFKNVRNLSHHNILRPDHYDEYEKRPYLVMTYCPNSVGNMGILNERDIWQLIKDVSAGLAYLHDMDIVHRDIKPDNILQNNHGVYVISDFGLSQRMRSTLRKASGRYDDGQNPISGTIGYMAPEMFSARPQAVKATDIWALGATIYEVATGEMPFCGQGGIMEQHGAELPELPSNFGATLSYLMQRCLSKDAWDRPTAKEINIIAHQVCPDLGEGQIDREFVSEIETYKKEIDALNAEIRSLKQAESSADKGSGNRKYVICIASLLMLIMLGGGYGIFAASEITSLRTEIHRGKTVIEEIYDLCAKGNYGDDLLENWEPYNHAQNSVYTKTFHVTAYKGDILSFDYHISYDDFARARPAHFVTKVISKQDTTIIKDVYGRGNGSVLYEFKDEGEKIIRMEYRTSESKKSMIMREREMRERRDYAEMHERDYAKITNIKVEHCTVGQILQKIREYESYGNSGIDE